MAWDMNQIFTGGAGLLGGLFGNSDDPYKRAAHEYRKYARHGIDIQNPFYQAGINNLPAFQNWLAPQGNPSDFINNLMSGYKESPWAQFEQQQAQRALQNMGSASGLTGSTPMAQFGEQYARDISSQDMQNWLGRVLGINTQYGQGLEDIINRGAGAGNIMSGLYGDMGASLGKLGYGASAASNNDFLRTLMGLAQIGAGIYA